MNYETRELNDAELNTVIGGKGPECTTTSHTISNDAGIFTVSWGTCSDGQAWVTANWNGNIH